MAALDRLSIFQISQAMLQIADADQDLIDRIQVALDAILSDTSKEDFGQAAMLLVSFCDHLEASGQMTKKDCIAKVTAVKDRCLPGDLKTHLRGVLKQWKAVKK